MAKHIPSVSAHPKFDWSALLDPVHVRPRDLPATAGIYMVVACDANGTPVTMPNEPPHSQMKGVAYIGLTGKSYTLKNRFAALARAWRPHSKQKKPSHGSREHYNADLKAQALFKVEHVRIRFMPLPTDSKTEPKALTDFATQRGMSTDEFREMFGLGLIGDKLVADSEANSIQWFKKQNGYIPMLNRREEGAGDKPPTDAERAELLKRT